MTQDEALEIMMSGENCFLTGQAGTGKTFLVQNFINQKRESGNNVVIVAPTGIAAINVGGATIHSTFRMFGNYLLHRIPKRQNVSWHSINTIVIDEISMVGPDYLDYIDYLLKYERGNQKPFGGIQMILVGDPKQLPPVYGNYTEQDKSDLRGLINKYGSLTFDKAEAYKGFKELSLTHVYRQRDTKLIDLLNKVREGDLSVLNQFNNGRGNAESVFLMPYNVMVDKHNDLEFEKLKGEIFKYDGIISGDFNTKNCITPERLELKVGARVMVTKNLQCGLVNGDLGHVVKCSNDGVIIYSDRLKDNFPIVAEQWKEITYDGINEIVVGTYDQIPLKLSWAITIHKSQGLSLENVCLTVVKGMSRELIYVGLSRCTNFENLFINAV